MSAVPFRFDIYNENFESYFRTQIEKLTPDQRANIPTDILFKLFKGDKANSNKLSTIEKMYVLSVALGKEVIIHIQDENLEMSPKDFTTALAAKESKKTNTQMFKVPVLNAGFMVSSKEIFSTLMYVNHSYCSDIYQLIRKIKPYDMSKQQNEMAETQSAIRYLTDLLVGYEKHKKRIVMEFRLDVPRIYALLYFAGKDKLYADFRKEFKYAYSANLRHLSQGVGQLQKEGYLIRRGTTKDVKFSLSAKGIVLLDKLLLKILTLIKNS